MNLLANIFPCWLSAADRETLSQAEVFPTRTVILAGRLLRAPHTPDYRVYLCQNLAELVLEPLASDLLETMSALDVQINTVLRAWAAENADVWEAISDLPGLSPFNLEGDSVVAPVYCPAGTISGGRDDMQSIVAVMTEVAHLRPQLSVVATEALAVTLELDAVVSRLGSLIVEYVAREPRLPDTAHKVDMGAGYWLS